MRQGKGRQGRENRVTTGVPHKIRYEVEKIDWTFRRIKDKRGVRTEENLELRMYVMYV